MSLRGAARRIAWSDESRDLLQIAIAALFADRLASRTRGQPRSLEISVPVRRPEAWRELRAELESALAILTRDRITFGFRRARAGQVVLDGPPEELPAAGAGKVSLFSGGLDSASAAARFARDGLPVTYVTQYSSAIREIEDLLRSIYAELAGGVEPRHASFFIRPRGPVVRKMRENTRRSRSFLFVSLALATAAGTGASEVYVCENGPLALNLPLSRAMVPTRHAHGLFLGAMERLASALYGREIRVTNPFELETKGEMTAVFREHPELALRTVSCWYQQFSGRGRRYGRGHCGHCLPCLVRRASLKAAGIEVPRRHFDLDVRRLERKAALTPAERRNLGPLHMLRDFAADLSACRSRRSFLRSFSEVLEHQPTFHRMPARRWFQELYRTMQRFAAEVRSVFG